MPQALWAKQETPCLPESKDQQDHRESKHAGNVPAHTERMYLHAHTHARELTPPLDEKRLDFPLFSPLTNPGRSKGCLAEEKGTGSCAKTLSTGLMRRWLGRCLPHKVLGSVHSTCIKSWWPPTSNASPGEVETVVIPAAP